MGDSITSSKWKYRQQTAEENTFSGLHTVLVKLLSSRSYLGEVDKVLYPDRSHTFDPFLMKNMALACDRIEAALRNKEKVRIYGDYDADGVTSVALLYLLFRPLCSVLSYYTPNRHTEGYGISLQAIEKASLEEVQLLIALDCGTSDLKASVLAKEKGIDLIICDHHVPGEELPFSVALLNPKQIDCPYPQKELSAAAIAFKLAQALAVRGLISEEEVWAKSDLLAVSLVADQISLTGEARTLLCEGLNQLQRSPSLGLSSLMKKLHIDPQQISSKEIGYQIAPPLNAAGRMLDASTAVELLTAESSLSADYTADKLLLLNTQRKEEQKKAYDSALSMLDDLSEVLPYTFLYKEEWHPGVVGIVAARCMEIRPRPTIVLTEVEGKVVGSLRSIEPINAYSLLKYCASLLERFGGHRYAAGCSLLCSNLEDFRKEFASYVVSKSVGTDLRPVLWLDLSLSPTEVDESLYVALDQLAPYGKENPVPLFYACGLQAVRGSVRLLRDKHLFFRLVGPNGSTYEAVGFGMGNAFGAIAKGVPFHIAYEVQRRLFNGERKLQLLLKDISFD